MVVCRYREVAAVQVWSKLVGGEDYREAFHFCYGVIPLSLGKSTACIDDDLLASAMYLHEYSSNTRTTSIGVKPSWGLWIKVAQNWS